MSVGYSKWIKLNVGGQSFQTTLTTLMSCPDSILAKMFDSESGLEPAYSEEGVYFLDANPKYFSIILDWLRYREVMADSDIKLGDVAKVANFFGLQELADKLKKIELEEELKKADGELKKAGGQFGFIFTCDDGVAAQHIGDRMGLYFKESNKVYHQAGGRMCLNQNNRAYGRTFTIVVDSPYLKSWRTDMPNIFGRGEWEFRDKNTNEWKKDGEIRVVELSGFKFCNTVNLSSTKYQHSEFLGDFHRVPGDWLNGWPVFKNQEGNYLRVASGTSCWSVNRVRDTDANEEDKLSSNRVTSCPAHNKAGTSVFHPHWWYGRGLYDETLNVTCDVHGSYSQ